MGLTRLEGFQESPVRKSGAWTPSARKLARFYGVKVRELFTEAVSHVKLRPIEEEELLNPASYTTAPSPESLLEAKELVQRLILDLKANHQYVLLKRYAEDWTYAEIALYLGCSDQYVRELERQAWLVVDYKMKWLKLL